ncbi:MAG: DegT/DnrJ/EryC1/StrS family aminotransferase, partial [Cytophagales bacterium]|nr:DegT/DnrJ/EryC1/StrS family aminotransferase [Cytophagales bacterium]
MPGPEIFGKEEIEEVWDVLSTGVLMRYNHDDEREGIWKAKTFEQEFAAYHDVKYCHMCASGTSADAIALAACGVGVGDEVIVAPFSFIAPVETVLGAG